MLEILVMAILFIVIIKILEKGKIEFEIVKSEQVEESYSGAKRIILERLNRTIESGMLTEDNLRKYENAVSNIKKSDANTLNELYNIADDAIYFSK